MEKCDENQSKKKIDEILKSPTLIFSLTLLILKNIIIILLIKLRSFIS